MLRKIRIAVAFIVFVLLTFFFLDSTEWMPTTTAALAKSQLIPAALALNVGVLLFLFLLTFFFGRVYCSVICPLGIFQDIVNGLSKRFKKKKYGYSRPKNGLRYGVLALLIVGILANVAIIPAIFDPYSAYGRMVMHLFRPVYDSLGNGLAWAIDGLGYHLVYNTEIVLRSVAALSIASLTMVVVTALAWMFGRTYCNTICPAGTFLGLISRYSLFKVRVDESKCNKCGLCGRKCKASCINSAEQSIDYSRCVGCFDCIDTCPHKAIRFAYKKPEKEVSGEPDNAAGTADTSRRQFLATTLLMTALAPQMLAQKKVDEAAALAGGRPRRKRPPIIPAGAISIERFTSRCTSCHLCVSKCPSQVLRPSVEEYGWSGIMQPTMVYASGYCDYNCHECGEVCPVGAILPLTVDQKRKVKIGTAKFNINHCVVKLNGEVCGNCAKHCPVQAIAMEKHGEWVIPVVNETLCIGCGACEAHCPGIPHPAIRVYGLERHENIDFK